MLLYTADEEGDTCNGGGCGDGSLDEIDFDHDKEQMDLVQLISLGHQQLLLDDCPSGSFGGSKANSSNNNVWRKYLISST